MSFDTSHQNTGLPRREGRGCGHRKDGALPRRLRTAPHPLNAPFEKVASRGGFTPNHAARREGRGAGITRPLPRQRIPWTGDQG